MSQQQKTNAPQNHYLRPNQPAVCSKHGVQKVSDGSEECCPLHNLDVAQDALRQLELAELDQKDAAVLQSQIPCKPVASLRAKRRRFTVICTLFTLGSLLLSFTVPASDDILAPGPLCSTHAQILAEEGGNRCAACHSAGNDGFLAWAGSLFSKRSNLGPTQSELCLKCHEENLMGQLTALAPLETSKSDQRLFNAHGLPKDQLQSLTAKYTHSDSSPGFLASISTSLSASPGSSSDGKIACSTCHREHNGSEADLTALTDSQCQTCHKNRFKSLAEGHPEFTNYPQERRSKIAFDHSTHFGKHFPSQSTSFDCRRCHLDDDFQNVMKLAPFEQSCASCHDQPIRDSVGSGIELINLPMLDIDTLTSVGIDVGDWPAAAQGDFDGRIPELARMLLYADVKARAAFEQLGDDFEFIDLDINDRAQMETASQLVWAIKRLLHDLSVDCDATISNRLRQIVNDEKAEFKIEHFTSSVDPGTLRRAVNRWLPTLSKEMRARNLERKEAPAKDPLLGDSAKPTMRFASNGFRIQDDDILADNPLKKLVRNKTKRDQKGDTESKSNRLPVLKKLERPNMDLGNSSNPNSKVENKKRILNPTLQDTTLNDKEQNRIQNPLYSNPDDDLLAINPLSAKFSPNSVDGNTAPEILPPQGSESPPVQTTSPLTNVDKQKKDIPPPANSPPSAISSDVLWMNRLLDKSRTQRAGFWIEDDRTFSISYRPSGHADKFIQAVTDIATHNSNNDGTKRLMDQFLKPTSTGLCASCHTVDRIVGDRLAVNWNSMTRDPSIREFTRFSHRPHLIQPQTADCSSCHELLVDVDIQDSFSGFDPMKNKSNFRPTTKMDCMGCHQKGQASNSCTTCHNYHIGSKVISRIK